MNSQTRRKTNESPDVEKGGWQCKKHLWYETKPKHIKWRSRYFYGFPGPKSFRGFRETGAFFSKLPVITGPVKLFCFPFQTGVSKVLTIIQWSYQLEKQNRLHERSEHALLFLRLWFKNTISSPLNCYRDFRETGPRPQNRNPSVPEVSIRGAVQKERGLRGRKDGTAQAQSVFPL